MTSATRLTFSEGVVEMGDQTIEFLCRILCKKAKGVHCLYLNFHSQKSQKICIIHPQINNWGRGGSASD